MKKTYAYKEQTCSSLYELSEALGKEGIFIPLSISEDSLKDLGVTVTTEEESLESIKEHKILTLKIQRDNLEVEPIPYKDNIFDYDSNARDRINAALVALTVQGEEASIMWTTADNKDVAVTANDLRMIVATVALRSSKLHSAYRVAKEKVMKATTKEEVEKVMLNE